MSPVGTNVWVGENALPPTERSWRVLIGIETRSSSTGTPAAAWTRPAAVAAPVMKRSFTLPPSWCAAVRTSSSDNTVVSSRRSRDRSRHSGERCDPTVTCRSVDLATAVSSVPLRGSAAAPVVTRAAAPPMAEVDRLHRLLSSACCSTASVGDPSAGRSGVPRARVRRRVPSPGWGTGSRSKSRNCTESRMPPSPSVIVWCRRWSMAARPPRRPSMVTNSHRGRSRSNG